MRLTILNSSKRLSGLDEELKQNFDLAFKILCKYFNLDELDVTVSPFEKGEAPSSGIGGWGINRYRVEILLDTERQDIINVIRSEFPSVLAHEVHHIKRMELKLPGDTLAEHLIYEGLACHFEQIINGGNLPSLFKGIENNCWQSILTKMQPMLGRKDFHFPDYFYCHDSELYPKYAGYWVGFNLVDQYIKKNQISELEALRLPAEVFFEDTL
ncbi:MAG: hypothetical protein H6546_00020 [Chitinophagales bacterium]|nr:hypothetical protein [Chitinophagales bacterium]